MGTVRLDIILVSKGLFASRERARRAIESGCVKVNGVIVQKPSRLVDSGDRIESDDPLRYVSHGGNKLEKAITDFSLDFTGKIVLDLGASTGGFTDCVLQHGASFVYAVDVGTGQLHPSLQKHPQVKSIENRHIRDLRPEELQHRIVDLIVVDVSFISLTLIFPFLASFLAPGGKLVILIKPQFEAGKKNIGKGGLVKKEVVHTEVLANVIKTAAAHGFFLHRITWAPLDAEKNIEYLALFGHEPAGSAQNLNELVQEAFAEKKKISDRHDRP